MTIHVSYQMARLARFLTMRQLQGSLQISVRALQSAVAAVVDGVLSDLSTPLPDTAQLLN
ncbi:hypothetical protein [Actibacterium sp. 188UL27-1]|uniref:hypothetical protein n=1 Tax=Actibacterium sp. 188UL27-1 TaxID=2786961 RepID=UPI00195A8F30|nr:hypothetical protein [Actibacterium sp. 188UL27-1]MBM7070409.1 hypothetical protein [Actibacterium sp. 188UL27-1]